VTVIAIDPGAVSGAYAYTAGGFFTAGDLPVVDGQVDAAALAQFVRDHVGPELAVVERVGAMPKQGVASTFRFGKAAGIIEGVLAGAGIPIHYVAPQTWKKHFRLSGTDKEKSRALAIQRHPTVQGLHLKKHHGRAEALLMLDWYLATTGERP
jgi:hypothetical protein